MITLLTLLLKRFFQNSILLLIVAIEFMPDVANALYSYANSPCKKTQYQITGTRIVDPRYPSPAYSTWSITDSGLILGPREKSSGKQYAVRVAHEYWSGVNWTFQGGTSTDGAYFEMLGEGKEMGIYYLTFGECQCEAQRLQQIEDCGGYSLVNWSTWSDETCANALCKSVSRYNFSGQETCH